ncbi:hypothetical protein K440DRAFT_613318 [Wilcoxina mikolae CBS 423.85]|nr:hypothetical protein K440DRAFT_613318 [Wilcoxina mikolae CBS 423.85]
MDKLLHDIDEDRRRLLMSGNNMDDEALHQEVEASLGGLSKTVLAHLVCLHKTLEEIESVLQSITITSDPSPVPTTSTQTSPIYWARRAIKRQLKSRSRTPTTTSSPGTRRRLRFAITDTPGELKALHEELRKQNTSLQQCLVMVHLPERNRSPTPNTTAIETSTIAEGSTEPILANASPTKLYQALAKAPPCQCHLLHLRLETTSGKGLDTSERDVAYSALVTSIMTQTSTGDLILKIVDALNNDDGSNSELTLECANSLCEALFSNDQDDARYSIENFQVERVRDLRGCKSGNCTVTTLYDLVHKDPRVSNYDRYMLAVNLGKAAVSFHSSPWIRGWTAKSIKFFEEYEESKQPATWKPHVSITLNSASPYIPINADVYALGMMLFEISGIDIQKFESPLKDSELKDALRTVTVEMGRQFKKVAECCFSTYQGSGLDKQQLPLNALLKQIGELEKLASTSFKPEDLE